MEKNYVQKTDKEHFKRSASYTLADGVFINDVQRHLLSLQNKVEAYGYTNWIQYLQEWNLWFDNYLSHKQVGNIPQSWSTSGVLPFGIIISEGSAGSGKTFCMNTLLRSLKQGTLTSYRNLGTATYLKHAIADSMHQSQGHVKHTFFKMFNIHFLDKKIDALLKYLCKDEELNKSYATLKSYVPTNPAECSQITREHFALVADKAWPLVSYIYDLYLKEFKNNHSDLKYQRRVITDQCHPHYTANDILVPKDLICIVDEVKRYTTIPNYKSTNFGLKSKDCLKQVELSHAALSQDAYVLQTLMKVKSPPDPVLYQVLVFEEEGQCAAIYDDIRKLLTMILIFMYNPVFIHQTVPVVIYSGSTTQSSAIGSSSSCLEIAASLTNLKDTETVLAYRSDFFRRGLDEFLNKDLIASRALCIGYEQGLKQNEYSQCALLTHEVDPVQLEDPTYIPQGVRLMCQHRHVKAFVDAQSDTEQANVGLTDIMYVSNLIVMVDNQNTSKPDNSWLSKLSEAQAKRNRFLVWKEKVKKVYSFFCPQYEPVNYLGIDFSNDIGGLPRHEEEILSRDRLKVALINASRKYIVNNERCLKRTLGGGKTVLEDSIENNMFETDVGATVISDDIFATEIQEDIEYQKVTMGIKKPLLKRKKRLDEQDKQTIDQEIPIQEALSDKPVMFIVNKASKLISQEEHRVKSMYAEEIAKCLGNGEDVAKLFLSGCKVEDQTGPVKYCPESDMVVEYANPSIKQGMTDEEFQNSLQNSINGRIVYMCFKRERKMIPQSIVTNEYSTATNVVFRGVSCTTDYLMKSTMFTFECVKLFRCLVLGGVMDKFKAYCVSLHNFTFNADTSDKEDVDEAYEKLQPSLPCEQTDIIQNYENYTKKVHEKLSKYLDMKDESGEIDVIIDDILDNYIGFVSSLEMFKSFYESFTVNVAIDSHSLYVYFKYKLFKPCALSKLHCEDIGSIKVLGKGKSIFSQEWCRAKMVSSNKHNNSTMTPYQLLMHEKRMLSKNMKITPTQALWMGVEHCDFPTYLESMNTLLLRDTIVVTLHPSSRPIMWSKIFSSTKSNNRFGIMLRRGMADIGDPEDTLQNNVFNNPGELIGLPYPFKGGAFSGVSDIIVKTKIDITAYALDSNKIDHENPGKVMKPDQKQMVERSDLQCKKLEILAFICSINPFYGSPAMTVAASQGSTTTGHVLIPLDKVDDNNRLVALTRTTNIKNLKVASLLLGIQNRESVRETEFREGNQRRSLNNHFFKYRQ